MNEHITRKPEYEEFIAKVDELCIEYGFKIDVSRETSRGRLAVRDSASGVEMTHDYIAIRFGHSQ